MVPHTLDAKSSRHPGSGKSQSSRSRGSARLKAFAAEDGSALSGAERHSRLLPASRAGGLRLHLGVAVSLSGSGGRAEDGNPLGLASLAALGFVLELFVVEEKLFPSREDEITPTVDTLQHLVLKFHRGWLPSARFRAPTRGEGTAVVHRKYRLCTAPPLYCPLDSARHAPRRGAGTTYRAFICRR